MAVVPFAIWAPDAAAVDGKYADTVRNVRCTAAGYGPVLDLVPKSLPLPANAKGGVKVVLSEGSPLYFAGTVTDLYRFDPVTSGWSNVSKTAGIYSVPDDDYWSFRLFGSTLIATHINAPPQIIDINGLGHFADLNGSGVEDPPRARFVDVVGDVVVLGGLVDFPNRMAWSALNDITGWDPGIDGADIQEFPDGGDVMAFAGGEFGLVFQQSKIRRMVQTADPTNLFQFSVAEESRGALSPWVVIKRGARVFFLDTDGFYEWADGAAESTPIGAEVVNSWFIANNDRTFYLRTLGGTDSAGPRVFWAFRSATGVATGNTDALDMLVVYNWQLQRWAAVELTARVWFQGATLAVALDAIADNVDLIETSFDSSLYAGNVPTLSALTADNRLAFQEGPNIEATLETVDAMIARPMRAFVRRVRVSTDADAYSVSVGGREKLSAGIIWKPPSPAGADGFCPARCSARFHRARVVIAANQPWKYATGIEPDAVKDGER